MKDPLCSCLTKRGRSIFLTSCNAQWAAPRMVWELSHVRVLGSQGTTGSKVARAAPSVVLEKTLESPLDCKEIKPVNPKGNQSWIFIGKTDAEAETPILCPPDAKSWLIWKDPDAGKDWRQEEMGMTEDEMVGWHHRLNGHEFEQALGVVDE